MKLSEIFKRKPVSLRVVIHPHTTNRYEFTMFPGETMNIPIGDKVWFAEWSPHDESILFMQVIPAADVEKRMKERNLGHIADAILDMDKMRPFTEKPDRE